MYIYIYSYVYMNIYINLSMFSCFSLYLCWYILYVVFQAYETFVYAFCILYFVYTKESKVNGVITFVLLPASSHTATINHKMEKEQNKNLSLRGWLTERESEIHIIRKNDAIGKQKLSNYTWYVSRLFLMNT